MPDESAFAVSRLLPWLGGAVAGFLVQWGAQRAEMKRLRQDIEKQHQEQKEADEKIQTLREGMARQEAILLELKSMVTRLLPHHH